MATASADSVVEKKPLTVEELNVLRLEGFATDLTISTREGTDVEAHRVIIAGSCPAMQEELSKKDKLDLSSLPLW